MGLPIPTPSSALSDVLACANRITACSRLHAAVQGQRPHSDLTRSETHHLQCPTAPCGGHETLPHENIASCADGTFITCLPLGGYRLHRPMPLMLDHPLPQSCMPTTLCISTPGCCPDMAWLRTPPVRPAMIDPAAWKPHAFQGHDMPRSLRAAGGMTGCVHLAVP